MYATTLREQVGQVCVCVFGVCDDTCTVLGTPTPWRNMYIMVQPDRPSLHRLPFGRCRCCQLQSLVFALGGGGFGGGGYVSVL